jgi:MYXO-CTERM domain-containing protein
MKFTLLILIMFCLSAKQATLAQGVIYIYDQQSSTNEAQGAAGGGNGIQGNAPFGQSFTPSLSAVGFIRLNLQDYAYGNGLGATLYVNLRTDSITGTVLSASAPVFMPDGYVGFTNFIFSNPVSVTPGTTYFFEPIVQSGDFWNAGVSEYNYPGGTSYAHGIGLGGGDFWFREGIIVPAPEPGTLGLGLLGAGLLWAARQRAKVKRQKICS